MNDTPRILTLADITVRRFMQALFNKDLTDLPNWEELYTSYIDLSGLGQEGQLGLYVGIHNLEVRLSFMTTWLETQAGIFKATGIIYTPGFENVHRYGHRPVDNAETFETQLNRIEAKEKTYVSHLRKLRKELEQMQKAEKPETVNARNQFVTMLNVIGKSQQYAINKDTTDMEELCLMIKQHGDDVKAAAHQS